MHFLGDGLTFHNIHKNCILSGYPAIPGLLDVIIWVLICFSIHSRLDFQKNQKSFGARSRKYGKVGTI